jgi:hypothetical protein
VTTSGVLTISGLDTSTAAFLALRPVESATATRRLDTVNIVVVPDLWADAANAPPSA